MTMVVVSKRSFDRSIDWWTVRTSLIGQKHFSCNCVANSWKAGIFSKSKDGKENVAQSLSERQT